MSMWLLFFFKQKTAYELRISDWSSDVCSSYLIFLPAYHHGFDRYPRSSRLCASGYRAGTDINSPDQYSGDQYVRQSGAEHWPGPRAGRSEERRVGKECVSTSRSRWSTDHEKKKKYIQKLHHITRQKYNTHVPKKNVNKC